MDQCREAAAQLTGRAEPSELAVRLMEGVFQFAKRLEKQGCNELDVWRECRVDLESVFDDAKTRVSEESALAIEGWRPNIDIALGVLLGPLLQEV